MKWLVLSDVGVEVRFPPSRLGPHSTHCGLSRLARLISRKDTWPAGVVSMRGMPLSALALLFATLASNSHAQQGTELKAALAPYAAPQRRIEVGAGRYIHLICMGAGSPTVILSAGADGWAASWRLVQPEVARNTRACAWDRAGHGFSSGSPEPQDVLHTEADLERALDGAGLTGPFVMVAHSLGAFETLIFADRHPDRVAGMVLVDPSTPDQAERLRKAAPTLMAFSDKSDEAFFSAIRACVGALKTNDRNLSPDCAKLRAGYPEPLRTTLLSSTNDALYWESFLSMFEADKLDSKLVINAKRNYGNMPLIVLDAGIVSLPGAPAEVQREIPALRALKEENHRSLSRLSTRGLVVPVLDSDHAIPLRRPDVVIQAVGKIVNQVREAAPAIHPRE